ncbi:MAG: alanine dehydrogenase [Thermoproteota archaeon]
MGRFKTLILREEEVRDLLSMEEVIEAVESAFREKGLNRVQMPPKAYLFYQKYHGDLRTMPSYLEKLDISAVKIVSVHPKNRQKYNLPTVNALLILVNPKNGFPLAIMSGTTLTTMRTGAAGGIASKYLAKEDSKSVCLIGAGAQARTQLMALVLVQKELEEVRVYDKIPEAGKKFVAEISSTLNRRCNMFSVESAEKAVRGSDIVVTATPSRKPVVKNEWIKPGTHLTCIGADAPGKEELDPEILTRAKLVIDDWEQASHSGEINIPLSQGVLSKEDIWGEIGEIVAGLKPGRESSREITVFSSTGLAVQDAVTAELAYDNAQRRGIGRTIQLT